MKDFIPKNYKEFKDIIEAFDNKGVLLFRTYSTRLHREVVSWIKPSKLLDLEEWR